MQNNSRVQNSSRVQNRRCLKDDMNSELRYWLGTRKRLATGKRNRNVRAATTECLRILRDVLGRGYVDMMEK